MKKAFIGMMILALCTNTTGHAMMKETVPATSTNPAADKIASICDSLEVLDELLAVLKDPTRTQKNIPSLKDLKKQAPKPFHQEKAFENLYEKVKQLLPENDSENYEKMKEREKTRLINTMYGIKIDFLKALNAMNPPKGTGPSEGTLEECTSKTIDKKDSESPINSTLNKMDVLLESLSNLHPDKNDREPPIENVSALYAMDMLLKSLVDCDKKDVDIDQLMSTMESLLNEYRDKKERDHVTHLIFCTKNVLEKMISLQRKNQEIISKEILKNSIEEASKKDPSVKGFLEKGENLEKALTKCFVNHFLDPLRVPIGNINDFMRKTNKYVIDFLNKLTNDAIESEGLFNKLNKNNDFEIPKELRETLGDLKKNMNEFSLLIKYCERLEELLEIIKKNDDKISPSANLSKNSGETLEELPKNIENIGLFKPIGEERETLENIQKYIDKIPHSINLPKNSQKILSLQETLQKKLEEIQTYIKTIGATEFSEKSKTKLEELITHAEHITSLDSQKELFGKMKEFNEYIGNGDVILPPKVFNRLITLTEKIFKKLITLTEKIQKQEEIIRRTKELQKGLDMKEYFYWKEDLSCLQEKEKVREDYRREERNAQKLFEDLMAVKEEMKKRCSEKVVKEYIERGGYEGMTREKMMAQEKMVAQKKTFHSQEETKEGE